MLGSDIFSLGKCCTLFTLACVSRPLPLCHSSYSLNSVQLSDNPVQGSIKKVISILFCEKGL